MRASRRALVLGFLVALWMPAAASAAPITTGTSSLTCGALVADATNCSLFAFDPFSEPDWNGEFETGGDLALFSFTFDEAARLTVTTSSYAAGNFDPQLGLFHADGSLLELPDGTAARFFDINIDILDYDDHIDVELAAGSYYMALAVSGLRESLFAGSECDFDCGFPGTTFAFSVSATPLDGGTEPVPEPATVTLVAGGAVAGWWSRRRAKKRRSA